jgi:hypothetical protein
MKVKQLHIAICLAFSLSVASAAIAADSRIAVKQDEAKGEIRLTIDGKEALVYCYGDQVDLPHLYPIRSPNGKSMTVRQTSPYPHHRSFWFADKVQLEGKRPVGFYGALYSSVAGRKDPKPPYRDHVRHVKMTSGKSTSDAAKLTMNLLWEMDGDTPVLDEVREMRVVALGEGEYLLDIEFTLTANYGDVAFVSDSVHYAWPYVRMNAEFSVQGGGRITNSEGGIDQKGTHGKTAQWVDYSNTTSDKNGGLAVFSHSDNEQPHKWLTRDYGTFGPRRLAAKSGKRFTLKKGESISQRVGVLVHAGDVEKGRVAERYKQYLNGKL